MKNLFLHHLGIGLLIYFTFAGLLPQQKATTLTKEYFTVSGRMETSGAYCGGANPGREIIEKIRAKRPLVNYKLYLRAGKTNDLNAPIIDSTVTDEAGRFAFRVPAGSYVLLSKDQVDRARIRACLHHEYIEITDFDCLEAWWQNGLAQVDVYEHSVDDLHFYLRKLCFLPLGVPCIFYTGPLPP